MIERKSKKILNKIIRNNESVIKQNKKSIKINRTDENIEIIIPKFLIKTLTPFQLSNSILASISPIFSDNSTIKKTNFNKNISNFKHIAFFIEQMPYYTGGRYSIFEQAVLLSQFTKVTVVSNQMPPFYNDFKDYYNDNFRFVESSHYLSNKDSNEFDIIVGCPVKGGVLATYYAEKFNLPLYLILFESPNWVIKFRDGADGDEEFWKEYKQCLLKADKIMVPSFESKKYALEWLKINKDKIEVVYPCINQVVADKIKYHKINIKHKNKKFNVVYISRMTPGKSILPVLKKFPKTKYTFNLIGKIWTKELDEIKKLIESGYDIIIWNKLNDKKKFELLSEADVLAFPTKFEGFGMPISEALYFDIPVVTYDLPVFREYPRNKSYKNKQIYFVSPIGDTNKFVKKVKEIVENNNK